MMHPLKNQQIERILSLIVIVHGLWFVIPNVEVMIYCQSRTDFFCSGLNLMQITIGCLLIVFFSRIVQWIGYFATEGKPRLKRRWLGKEILAIPLILYVFTEFLLVFTNIGSLILMALYYEYGFLWKKPDWLRVLPVSLVYLSFAVIVLFSARRIAAWLLRVTAVK